MIVNIHAAKTHLSKLIERAEAGEEVILARNGKPAARIVPLEASQSPDDRKEGELPSWMGSLKGRIWISPDIDEVDAEIAREFEESEIFPRQDGQR
ncbi:MAG TPA: type II toxin-antitoxin system prevent-host-death family antitoxin [Caulobacteraceae bacterium]|jgi:prevent-host-death family protein|nr:type II toxin-antitoxin system prevent-host-death family antitoxin [Caulobacteraceae bacterium]